MSIAAIAIVPILVGGPWLFGTPLGGAPLPAATPEPVAPVSLGAEAWYSSPQLCLASLCLPLPISPASSYPAGTLHVGALLGAESARTYLALKHPIDSEQMVTGGYLRLPLDTLPVDGSLAPEVAKVKACTTRVTVRRVAGATSKPPAVDCSNAPASRTVGTPATELDINLNPIVKRLSQPGTSLALLPLLSAGATFNVTVSSNRRANSSTTRPVLLLATSARNPNGSGPATPPSPSSDGDADNGSAPVEVPTGPIDIGPLTSEPPAGAVTPPLIATRFTPEALRTSATGFDYPVVFLVPLLLLAGLLILGRQLTRPLS